MTSRQESLAVHEDGDELRPWQRVAREIDLPPRTAVWVLLAHVLTILSPILIVVAVADHLAYLDTVFDRPTLLYVTAGLFIVGSVAESAQNTLDRWYLTGVPPSLLDLVFGTCVIVAIAFQVLAVAGDTMWVWPVSLGLAALYPVAYLMQWPTPPIQAVLGIASAVLLYRALDQPVVVLSLLTVFLTLFCLDILLKTLQQVMHGFTTIVNAFSVLATFAAISWAASGEAGWSWALVVGVAASTVAISLLMRPRLLKLGPTPRRYAEDLAA